MMLSFSKQNVSCCYIIPLSFTPRYKRLDQQNTGRCFLSEYVTSLFLYNAKSKNRRYCFLRLCHTVIIIWTHLLSTQRVPHGSPVLKNMYPYCICSLTDHSIKLLITIWTHLFLVIITQPVSQWSPFLIAAIRICDLTMHVKQVIKTSKWLSFKMIFLIWFSNCFRYIHLLIITEQRTKPVTISNICCQNMWPYCSSTTFVKTSKFDNCFKCI